MRTALFVICLFLLYEICMLECHFGLEEWFVWRGLVGITIVAIMLLKDWKKKR